MKNNKKAFTLIELLIVIALLGALAVALLASLDPLEQIKKGTDTGVRNTVAEISSSFTRYASVKSGSMPYPANIEWAPVGTTAGGVAYDAIAAVVATGELKADFMSLAADQLGKIYVVGSQSGAYVCFAPSAKSFKSDANAKFLAPAVGTYVMAENEAECTDATPGTTTAGAVCYWCVR